MPIVGVVPSCAPTPWTLLVVASVLAACDAGLERFDRRRPPLRLESHVAAAPDVPAPARDLDRLRHDLRRRAASPSTVPRRRLAACDDALLAATAPEEAQRLVFTRIVDHRSKARALLPLAFSSPIVDPDVAALDRPQASGDDRAGRGEAIEAALARRFDLVVHVEHYSPSARVLRPGRQRAEWTPAWVRGWITLVGAGTRSALCEADFDVRMEPDDAPLDRRLEAATRDRLTERLGAAARARIEEQLRRITRVAVLSPAP